MKSTDLLFEDHQYIRRALDVLEDMAIRARHGQEPDEHDLKDILEFLERFCDRIHQGREECIFFPALLRDQKSYQQSSALNLDHERERFLVQGLQDSLLASSRKSFVFCAIRLVEVLRRHIGEEEGKLFPVAELVLSKADDERLAREMNEYDRLWQEQRFADILTRLADLESKYLGKAHPRVCASRAKQWKSR